MKKNYIIPSTQSVAFQGGFICETASSATGTSVGVTGPNVGIGGAAEDIGTPD